MNAYLTIYKIHFSYSGQNTFKSVILYDFTGYKRLKSFEFSISKNAEKYIYLNAENNSVAVTDDMLNITGHHVAYLKIKRVDNDIKILESSDTSFIQFMLQDNSIYIRHLNYEVLDHIQITAQNITNTALDNFIVTVPKLGQDVIDYIQTTTQNRIDNALNNFIVTVPKLGQDVIDYIQVTAQNIVENTVNSKQFNIRIITDNYIANTDDDYLICDNVADITLTLPVITNETKQKVLTIKKINTGNVTIQTSNDQLIDRAVTSFTLIDHGQFIRLLPVNETIGWIVV